MGFTFLKILTLILQFLSNYYFVLIEKKKKTFLEGMLFAHTKFLP